MGEQKAYYKCGHNGKPALLDDNIISYTKYCEWKDTVGYDGDKSMCHDCFLYSNFLSQKSNKTKGGTK